MCSRLFVDYGTVRCAHCSTPVPENATFCHRCGSALSDPESRAAAVEGTNETREQQIERLLRAETGGEYEIEKLLGRGGMALVYLAKEVHLDRKVAIKVLPPDLTFGHGVERFKREAKTAAALDHPHIIPIHRIASGGKLFWYTMKYVEGHSLEDFLKQHERLSLERTIEILTPVADALDYAHENQVVHRDIKPANVILDERNRVTVADFGIAKALTEATLTASGSVIGTPYYMSPEQGMGKAVSGASDQYSVAVMAFRMLSGVVPFDGDSAIDILHKHCKEPPPPLSRLNADLPRYVYMAVDKALSKSPDARFSSVTAFARGLKALSPEISAEMDTVDMNTDPSVREEISTKLIGIADEDPAAGKEGAGTDRGPGGRTNGNSRKKTPWLIAIPLVLLIAGGGVIGGVWLSNRQGESDRGVLPNQVDPGTRVANDTTGTELEPSPPAPPPATGSVTVSELPPSGTITVDGQQQADTVFDLEPGTYTVRLTAPGHEDLEREVNVAAGSNVALEFAGAALVADVSVNPSQAELEPGEVLAVSARPVDMAGNVLRGRAVQWSSSAPTIATVIGAGRVRGVSQGKATIVATVEGQTASATVTVLPAAVGTVLVTPEIASLAAGETISLDVLVEDAAGRRLSGREISWESTDSSIATVTGKGVVSGVRAGSVNIVARTGGRAGESALTVNAPEVQEQVDAQPPVREISGPEDLFARAAPEGWSLVPSDPPEIAKYDSRLGTIRILRVRQNTPEAILDALREGVGRRMASLEELAPTSTFHSDAGEPVLVQVLFGIEGSGFNEARFRVILAAARNEHRGVGVVALLEHFVDPDQGQADVRTLLESLRR